MRNATLMDYDARMEVDNNEYSPRLPASCAELGAATGEHLSLWDTQARSALFLSVVNQLRTNRIVEDVAEDREEIGPVERENS